MTCRVEPLICLIQVLGWNTWIKQIKLLTCGSGDRGAGIQFYNFQFLNLLDKKLHFPKIRYIYALFFLLFLHPVFKSCSPPWYQLFLLLFLHTISSSLYMISSCFYDLTYALASALAALSLAQCMEWVMHQFCFASMSCIQLLNVWT